MDFRDIQVLTLQGALTIANAAIERAEEMQLSSGVVVVDSRGDPIVVMRMDGAMLDSTEFSLNKARSVVRLGGVPTGQWEEIIGDDSVVMNAIILLPGRTVLPGGAPVLRHGALAGAVGVSGGTKDQDQKIADAAARALDQS